MSVGKSFDPQGQALELAQRMLTLNSEKRRLRNSWRTRARSSPRCCISWIRIIWMWGLAHCGVCRSQTARSNGGWICDCAISLEFICSTFESYFGAKKPGPLHDTFVRQANIAKSLANQEKMFFLTNTIEHAKIRIAKKPANEVILKRPFENAPRKPLTHKA